MRRTGSGATENITRRDDRRIVRQALVDHIVTHFTIKADVGAAVFIKTIFRFLVETNLKSKRRFLELSLAPDHRRLRLQRCQAQAMWNATHWEKGVLSVESRFALSTDDNRVRV